MKKLLSVLACVCMVLALSLNARAQNLTTVSASNITDINGTKLASGQLCFLITDQQDNPISVSIGGGGQALRRGYCSPVSAGVVTGFTVPNPASTQPAGIYYRVTVKDSSTGQEVLRYTQVSFTGGTFNFDNYAPQNLGNAAPLSGNSVTGNLSVTGNVAATGTVNGSNIPAGQINTGAGTTNAIVKYTNGATGGTGNSSLSDNGTTVSTTENLSIQAATAQSNANLQIRDVTGNLGNQVEFGHTNTAGYGSNIGADVGDGDPFICFMCEGGTTTNTYRTRGNTASIIRGTTGGAIQIGTVSSSSADNQIFIPLYILNPNGLLQLLNPSGLLAAGISNDANGGVNISSNGGKTWEFFNSGNLTSPAGGALAFLGSTSGTTLLKGSATASGTLTLPAATDTLVGQSTTDTLANKTLTAPKIGTETISSAPRMVWSNLQPAVTVAGAQGIFTPDNAITITKLEVEMGLSAVGCTTQPVLDIFDVNTSTSLASITLTNGSGNEISGGALSVNVVAGHRLRMRIATASSGCTTSPVNVWLSMQYKMQ